MITQLFKKQKTFQLERVYDARPSAVWSACTNADELRQWWGPDKTTVPECSVDLRIGGEIRVVIEAGPEMGKYAGTRWPMVGQFTQIEPDRRLVYEAQSTTEGEEATTTIEHTNELTLAEQDGRTLLHLHVTIHKIGPKAKMAAFGMKWGYKGQLAKLESLLS